MRAVPRLCEFYPGICLTTVEKAQKNLSQSTVYISPKQPHLTKPIQKHTSQKPHIHTHTLQNNIKQYTKLWGIEECRCNSSHIYLESLCISALRSLGPYGKSVLYPSDKSLGEFQNCFGCWEEEEESLLHMTLIEYRSPGRSARTLFTTVTDMWYVAEQYRPITFLLLLEWRPDVCSKLWQHNRVRASSLDSDVCWCLLLSNDITK